MEYLINIFTKPRYEISFIDEFILTTVFLGLIFLVYIIYIIIKDRKIRKKK